MGGEKACRAGRRKGAERVIHNSQEWQQKMQRARELAAVHNTRMAVVAHHVDYRGRHSWHYVIMPLVFAHATGHLKRQR